MSTQLQQMHDDRRAAEAADGKVRHVIADGPRFVRGTSDGPCTCDCGWTGLASAFGAHRTEARAKPPAGVFAGGLHTGLEWKPGKVATDGPAPLEERRAPDPIRRVRTPPVRVAKPEPKYSPEYSKEESMPATTLADRIEEAVATPPAGSPFTWPERPCQQCATPFTPTRRVQGRPPTYCSEVCRNAAELARKRARNAAARQVAESGEQAPDEPSAATSLLEDPSSSDHVPATPDLGDTEPVMADQPEPHSVCPVCRNVYPTSEIEGFGGQCAGCEAAEAVRLADAAHIVTSERHEQVANPSPAFDAIESAADLAAFDGTSARYTCASVNYRSRESHDLRCRLHDDRPIVPRGTSERPVHLYLDPEGATPLAAYADTPTTTCLRCGHVTTFPAGTSLETMERAGDVHEPTCPSARVTPATRSDDPTPETQTSPFTDDWQRGYEEGYRASIETVDAARADAEYQRGWSMGVLDTCLKEIRALATVGNGIDRLAQRAQGALDDL